MSYQESIKKFSLKIQSQEKRYFEKGYIENRLLDVDMVCSKTKLVIGRPWITLLIDKYTSKIIETHLSFEPPTYITCIMVYSRLFRKALEYSKYDCIRLWKRRP